jgi:hypothetical protein
MSYADDLRQVEETARTLQQRKAEFAQRKQSALQALQQEEAGLAQEEIGLRYLRSWLLEKAGEERPLLRALRRS